MLVGIAGRWWTDKSGVTEFVTGVTSPIEQKRDGVIVPQGLKKILRHPGFGKTRRVIPELIDQHLAEKKEKRVKVVLLGPTRVVCSEIHNALKSKYGQMISLNIKGSGKSGFGQISVMAHHTYWELCTRSEGLALNPTLIIVDEVHARDISTRVLRKITEKASETVPAVWLTATEEPDYCEGSNFPIEDVKVEDMQETIEAELCEGKSVGVFLPSVEGRNGIKAWKKKLAHVANDAIRIIELHRGTYEGLRKTGALSSSDQRLVLMTNFAEMGMNMDLDAVVDSGTEFVYIDNVDTVDPVVRQISMASRIQRRKIERRVLLLCS